jgi:hypothetical protein
MAIKDKSTDQTLVEHEAEMLGLWISKDEGFKVNDSHWHETRLCMTITVAKLRRVGPIQVPTPHKIIRISQKWDTGGSRLCPLEDGFYEETKIFQGPGAIGNIDFRPDDD